MLLAQDLGKIQSKAFGSGVLPSDIGELITTIIPYLFYAAGILLLIYLIAGGLQLMLSRGDSKAMQGAQAKITNALIGFAIVFVAYWVTLLVGKIFNIEIINSIFGGGIGGGSFGNPTLPRPQ